MIITRQQRNRHSKSQYCVVNTLDKPERKLGSKKFRETFQTITCDNGCENLDFEGIERSAVTKAARTKVYYAHPYSAWERGTNENTNKLIRRFIPKGINIGKYSARQIKLIEHWINNYPRNIFNGLSSAPGKRIRMMAWKIWINQDFSTFPAPLLLLP